jgi:heme/copper-type cytochrome/quinol oxidase subunit 1
VGLMGMPRRVYTYAAGLGWEPYNLVSTAGAAILGVGVLITLVNWYLSKVRGRPAGNDPWHGETLEWYAASPPVHYNFVTLPTVRSGPEATRSQSARGPTASVPQ